MALGSSAYGVVGRLGVMTAPLLATRDPALLDELHRLAAAADVAADVQGDPVGALRAWTTAPMVLVGVDVVEELAALAPPRRPGVHVVTTEPTPPDVYRGALALGAETVAELPVAGEWLAECLTDLGDRRQSRGLVVGVTGGSGGAGATTFACALGQVAARAGPSVVVDLDPLGPGVDRVLGLEAEPGVRWDDLCRTTGRLGARSLRESLPCSGGPAVLTWGEDRGRLPAHAVRETLSAATRGHDTVVVDLPRARDPLVDEVAARCDRLLLVVAPTVAGVAAAVRVAAGLPESSRLGLVVRGRGVPLDDVARVVTAPVLTAMPDQRGLAEAIDLGLGPVRSRRGPLGRAARSALDALAAREAAG